MIEDTQNRYQGGVLAYAIFQHLDRTIASFFPCTRRASRFRHDFPITYPLRLVQCTLGIICTC